MATESSGEFKHSTEKSNSQKWLILICGTYNTFVSFGMLVSINTLYVELLDTFQTSRKETSFVQTTFFGITLASGLITGIIVRRLGIKTCLTFGSVLVSLGFFLGWFATSLPYLIATIGILGGLGNSLVFISTIVFIAETFTERRSMALALAMVGSGLGQILLPLLLERLLDVYGWRGALLITSGLFLNILVSGALATSSLGGNIPFCVKQETNTEHVRKVRRQDIIQPMFLLFVFTATVSFGCTVNVIVLFMDYMDSQGISLQTGINVFIGYNVLGLVTRIGSAVLNLNKHVHSLVLYCLFALLLGCCLLLLRVASTFASIVILICLIGGGNGGMVGMVNVVPIDLCGIANAAIVVGITSMSTGIFTPVLGVLIGWIFDSTGSYSMAFDICGCITVGSSLVTLTTFGVRVWLRKGKFILKQERVKTVVTVPADPRIDEPTDKRSVI